MSGTTPTSTVSPALGGPSGAAGPISGNSFTEKLIDVTFKLGEGSFGEANFNEVKLSGLRCSAHIIKAGGQALSQLDLRVWGMSFDLMNKLSTLGIVATELRRNFVLVEAGTSETGMSAVFEGQIQSAWTDFSAMPDVPFVVQAFAGLYEQVKPITPSSYRGATDVVDIMAGLATRMGLAFENSGVTGIKLNDPYFPGTARDQVRRCAEAAQINAFIDIGKLAIWPLGRARGASIPVLSVDTGMVTYPSYTSNGIFVKALFNPSIGYGNNIQIKSSLKPANGQWNIYTLSYALESKMPGGNWFMMIEAAPPGYGPPSGFGPVR